MKRHHGPAMWVLSALSAPVALVDSIQWRGRLMPLWLLRTTTWHKRRDSPGRNEVERITLTPAEHLILAKYAGRDIP